MDTTVLDRPSVGSRRVDARRGGHNTEVSAQWASRPDDEKFLNIAALREAVQGRREASSTHDTEMQRLRFSHDDSSIFVDSGNGPAVMTNWSFGQVARSVGFSANELRKLPPYLATAVLQTMAVRSPAENSVMAYRQDGDDGVLLRAMTSASYGRIYDADIVAQVERIARAGSWKVPGVLNWADGSYNPQAPVTVDTTTLFASDRDVFMFLCDDTHPIEVGKLPNGDPDLMFRGFIVSNSEVGARKFRLCTMYLRGVCCNRILWGVEGFREIEIRHNAGAPDRFADEIMPSLDSYAALDADKLTSGVTAAKTLITARTEDEQVSFLTDLGFSQTAAKSIIATGERQEGARPSSVWDFAQAITAHAQSMPHADSRFEMEVTAGKLLDKVDVE